MIRSFKNNHIYLALALLLGITCIASARLGAVDIGYRDIWTFLQHALGRRRTTAAGNVEEAVFLHIRLPRIILSCFTGATLSVSGVLMQSLFRNPIVEPGLAGTSAGAALGAAFLFVMGQSLPASLADLAGIYLLPLFAFAGGLAATLIVYRLSRVWGRVNASTMILAGIAINALANGGTGFLSYIARDPQARSIVFWNLGTLSGASWSNVLLVTISTLTGIALSMVHARDLNALMLGQEEAAYLGVNANRLTAKLILVNTLMVSVATAVVGVISFVGLIVPHMLRMLKGSDNRFLIIASALAGAILLNLADMLARVIAAPSEFPIGVITAVVGAPVFLYLLVRNGRKLQKGGFYA